MSALESWKLLKTLLDEPAPIISTTGVPKLQPFFDGLCTSLNSSSTFQLEITFDTCVSIYCSRATTLSRTILTKLAMQRRCVQSKIVARAGKSTSTFYIVKLSPQTRSSATMAAVIASLRSQYWSNLDKPQQPSIAQDLLCQRVCRVWRPHYHNAFKTASW